MSNANDLGTGKEMPEMTAMMDNLMELFNDPSILAGFFGGQVKSKKPLYESLGDGYELRPIEILSEGGQFVVENRKDYSHLYHNGLKVSDDVFRKGGMGGRFKDGYCELIHYTPVANPKKSDDGFSYGTFVIINHLGEICLTDNESSDHPHHIGGHIASIGNYIYDLRTGKAITPRSSTVISAKNSLIIEHSYKWYNKEVELPLGVYQIDYATAKITKLDDTK